jgi:uncharacterized protein (TIGR00730 family)
MKRICVFCGSSPGARPDYLQAARELGHVLVRSRIGLVYGGARVGTMGEIATTVLQDGGEVIGVIPQALLEKEVAHTGLSDLRVVGSMHERKALMAELADGFIALPGGLGTIEEFFEILTWAQLGMHSKPCGFLNIAAYYSPLLEFMDLAASQKFVEPEHRAMIMVDENPAALLARFAVYQAPTVDKAKWALGMMNSSNA